jgi:Tfp pilus assembly protein PilE
MQCHACRQDNADNALFCAACRRPLLAPTPLPTRLEPLAMPAAPRATAASPGAGERNPGFARDRFAPPNAEAAGRTGDDSGVMTEEEAWEAVIGPSNTHYYVERFERLSQGDTARWHWPGALVTWYWFLYRKMWLGALIYFFAPSLVFAILGTISPVLTLVGWVGFFVAPAMLANGLYYRHCLKKIRDVRARGGSKEQMLARLEAAGGTSGIVVIIVLLLAIAGIGIVAAVALPAYQAYTVKAKVREAVLVGTEVAAAVGSQYEQTGTLPSGDDVNRLASERGSKYVRSISIDRRTGALTLKVDAAPSISGSIEMVPSADDNRHLTWSCSTEDLRRYVPRTCRGEGASER